MRVDFAQIASETREKIQSKDQTLRRDRSGGGQCLWNRNRMCWLRNIEKSRASFSSMETTHVLHAPTTKQNATGSSTATVFLIIIFLDRHPSTISFPIWMSFLWGFSHFNSFFVLFFKLTFLIFNIFIILSVSILLQPLR